MSEIQSELHATRPRLIEGGRGLVVTRIAKSFNKRPVVRSVSLSLKRGEVVGLLGPNGAGKTTCFYMITGLIPADTGSIEVDGHDVTKLPMYRRARLGIGYLPQEASIFRGLTAEQNVRAALEVIDRAYSLHDGRVLKEGTPAEIVSDRDVRRVYLGEKFTL